MEHKKAYALICLLSALVLGACGVQPSDGADDAPYDSEAEGALQSNDDPVELGLTTQELSADSKLALADAQAAITSCAGLPNFTQCGPATNAFTECEYGSTCGLSGQRDQLLYNYLCLNQVCTPFPTYVARVSCSRPAAETNGDTCAENSCSESCSFSGQCSESGPRYRRCSRLQCSNGQCNVPSNTTTTRVGSCSRETDYFDCSTTCSGRPTTGQCYDSRCVCNIP